MKGVARVAILAASVVAGLLAVAAPAAAATTTPTVTMTDQCGAVQIALSAAANIDVTRGGVVVRSGWHVEQSVTVGANDGDEIVVTVDSVETSHTYHTPLECNSPKINFSFEFNCQGLLTVHANNEGPGTASGFQVVTAVDGVEDLDPFPVGESDQLLQVPPGTVQLITDGGAVWLTTTYREPEGCSPDNIKVSFTDECGKIHISVTTTSKAHQFYFIVKNPEDPEGDVVDAGFVAADDPQDHTEDAVGGDEFAIYYPLPEPVLDLKKIAKGQPFHSANAQQVPGFVLVASHIHDEPDCGLPTTGSKTGLIAGIGGGLLVLGVGLFLFGRRRRVTATPAA